MLAHERNNLRAHVIAVERVYPDAIEKTFRRWHTRFLVPARAPSPLDKLSCRGLPEIMGQRRQNNSDLPRIRKTFDQLARAIHRQFRMNEDDSLRMPLRILRHPNQTLYLGEELLQGAELAQPLEPDGRTLRV